MPTAPTATAPTGHPRIGVRNPRRRQWIAGLLVVVVAAAVAEGITGREWLSTAWTALTGASPAWVLLALTAGLGSMACFGLTRQSALRAAGVHVRAADAVGAGFAAGAVHTTMPGGAVFAAAYAFCRMRIWGASVSVAGWCLAITGVVAAATLTLLTVGGLALGGPSSLPRLALAAGAAAAVIALLLVLTRCPQLLLRAAGNVLRWLNRVRSRPAETGLAALSSLVDDLATIRPTRRQWLSCTGWSLANWVLDAVCLWAAAAAVGVHVPVAVLVVTYTAGMIAVSASPLPAGAGAVEAALAVGLTSGGAGSAAAVAAVLVYRVVSVGGIAAVGWALIGRDRHTAHRHLGGRPADDGSPALGEHRRRRINGWSTAPTHSSRTASFRPAPSAVDHPDSIEGTAMKIQNSRSSPPTTDRPAPRGPVPAAAARTVPA